MSPPVRRRRRWPWVAAIAALIAAGVGIWFGVTALQDELSKNTLVTVPFVEGQVEALAKKNITEAGLTSNVRREPSSNVPEGKVIEQSPGSGEKIARGNKVTIFVSQGAAAGERSERSRDVAGAGRGVTRVQEPPGRSAHGPE